MYDFMCVWRIPSGSVPTVSNVFSIVVLAASIAQESYTSSHRKIKPLKNDHACKSTSSLEANTIQCPQS